MSKLLWQGKRLIQEQETPRRFSAGQRTARSRDSRVDNANNVLVGGLRS
jgi:hypothetical protein